MPFPAGPENHPVPGWPLCPSGGGDNMFPALALEPYERSDPGAGERASVLNSLLPRTCRTQHARLGSQRQTEQPGCLESFANEFSGLWSGAGGPEGTEQGIPNKPS